MSNCKVYIAFIRFACSRKGHKLNHWTKLFSCKSSFYATALKTKTSHTKDKIKITEKSSIWCVLLFMYIACVFYYFIAKVLTIWLLNLTKTKNFLQIFTLLKSPMNTIKHIVMIFNQIFHITCVQPHK